MTETGRLDNWPATPVPVPDCPRCEIIDAARAAAVDRVDRPAETDARVLLRRHLAEQHT